MARARGLRFWLGILLGSLAVLAIVALLVWRDDIFEAWLDPKIPYSIYRPPPAPDYARRSAWARLPGAAGASRPVDVFFIHPTTFDGGKDWNGPIGDPASARRLDRSMLPNYAAPFASVGRVFAPRYRQASLYTSMTLFDDALEAREFAYGDVLEAFQYFLAHLSVGRPFIVAGVEQGGVIGERLLQGVIGPDPSLRSRLVAAYVIEAAVAADAHGPAATVPPCDAPDQTGCVIAWISAAQGDFERALRISRRSVVWDDKGRLVGLSGRPILCVNPLLGRTSDADAPARLNLGSANATDLEWGARPGFMARQVGARCSGGILRITPARSQSLRPSGDWASRLRARSYNLFWGNLEHDAQVRAAAYQKARTDGSHPGPPV